MSPLIHLITAWIIAMMISLELKERRIVVLSGIISDIDGVFILFSQDLFLEHHHGWGHSLVFGIPFVLILSLLFSRKPKVIVMSFVGFSSHLLLDIFGTNWEINPFYPFVEMNLSIYPILSNELIYWVIVPIFAVIVLGIMAWLIYNRGRSPVEFVSVKLDKIFTGFFIYPFKYKCKSCGKRASYYCESCKGYFCPRHVNKFFALKCRDCEAK